MHLAETDYIWCWTERYISLYIRLAYILHLHEDIRCRAWFRVDFPRTVTLIFIYSMLCGNWLIFRIDFMFNKRQYLYHGKRFAWCLFYILIFERRTSSVTLQVVGWADSRGCGRWMRRRTSGRTAVTARRVSRVTFPLGWRLVALKNL